MDSFIPFVFYFVFVPANKSNNNFSLKSFLVSFYHTEQINELREIIYQQSTHHCLSFHHLFYTPAEESYDLFVFLIKDSKNTNWCIKSSNKIIYIYYYTQNICIVIKVSYNFRTKLSSHWGRNWLNKNTSRSKDIH